jgi:subtilisin family serine protease
MFKIFTDEVTYDPVDDIFTYFVDPTLYHRALAECAERGVDVINLSIGGPGKPDHQERNLFANLIEGGTIVVAAMGNEREQGSPTSYPAAIPGVIAVGATALDDTVTEFSNRGPHIALSAPGKAIWSTLPTYKGQDGFRAVPGPDGNPVEGKPLRRETDYDAWDGTSMATPHVTAAVALLLANKGKLKPADARAALMAAADKVPDMGGKAFDSDYGAGRLNLLRLLS